ncbi:MAG TPA: hypothetical protein VGR26_05345 [Acidimicrobiales bacterium]|nr:hypothetical protein [Acidimicrobiales bacterium]
MTLTRALLLDNNMAELSGRKLIRFGPGQARPNLPGQFGGLPPAGRRPLQVS